jgi:hypothetical protein
LGGILRATHPSAHRQNLRRKSPKMDAEWSIHFGFFLEYHFARRGAISLVQTDEGIWRIIWHYHDVFLKRLVEKGIILNRGGMEDSTVSETYAGNMIPQILIVSES